ncbi:LuxR family transcriptional regulator [Mesorhizobium kowhaii]|uniref:LuxR family transcriptional regulator n=1 Tax=Mesorhizobium kowhaii TaxID=1300272 RepID=UPI0035EDD1CE
MNSTKLSKETIATAFGRFLDRTDIVGHLEQLFKLLSAFALNFDCPWIAYGTRPITPTCYSPTRRDPAHILNYPYQWQERYVEMGYDRIDPIIRASRRRAGAFRWRDLYNDPSTTEEERRIFDEAASFGLKAGISVPLHGPQGDFGVMSFAQSRDQGFPDSVVKYLELSAFHFHIMSAKFMVLRHLENTHELSSREIECIFWTAKGKSSWDIGQILGISVNTVNFHMKNIMRKLDTGSRTVAAIKAVNFGIIDL